LILYHGDNHKTNSINPLLMNNGFNQEGIGIYFSPDIKLAESYGKDIIKIEVNKKDFLPSRGIIGDYVSKTNLINFLKEGGFKDLSTDYGLEYLDYNKFYDLIKEEQIRNFQITIVEEIGVNKFLNLWKKHIKKQGLYDKNIYSVLYGKIIKDLKEEIKCMI